ncbi:MAG: hypothetical protein ABI721_02570 [Candidatus Dojkabacteria bacterium]
MQSQEKLVFQNRERALKDLMGVLLRSPTILSSLKVMKNSQFLPLASKIEILYKNQKNKLPLKYIDETAEAMVSTILFDFLFLNIDKKFIDEILDDWDFHPYAIGNDEKCYEFIFESKSFLIFVKRLAELYSQNSSKELPAVKSIIMLISIRDYFSKFLNVHSDKEGQITKTMKEVLEPLDEFIKLYPIILAELKRQKEP